MNKLLEEMDCILNEKKLCTGLMVAYGNNVDENVYSMGENGDGAEMTSHTLFDMASITKLFLAIVYIKLKAVKLVDFDNFIGDYTSKYQNISNLTIKQLLGYNVHLQTDKRIDDCSNRDEAIKVLYDIKGEGILSQEYSDMPSLVLAELLTDITKKSFGQLFFEMICKPLGLKETLWGNQVHTHTDCCSYQNEIWLKNNNVIFKDNPIGIVNDPKARILSDNNILSGNSGIFMSTHDIIKFSKAFLNGYVLSEELVSDLVRGAGWELCSDHQSFGYFCYRKYVDPIQTEVPHSASDIAFAAAGYTGCYVLIDVVKNGYVFIGANRLKDRISKVIGINDSEECVHIRDKYCSSVDFVYERDTIKNIICENLLME